MKLRVLARSASVVHVIRSAQPSACGGTHVSWWRNTAAQTFLGIGVVLLGLVAFSFINPHGHHNTNWIRSRPEFNYRVDVIIGLAVSGLAVLAWFLPKHRVSTAR